MPLWTNMDAYMLHELNWLRNAEEGTDHDVQPLHFNVDLQEAAIKHSSDDLLIADNPADSTGHSNPATDYTNAGGVGAAGHYFAQNHSYIAGGSVPNNTSNADQQAIVDTYFMAGYENSPSHLANMLDARHEFAGISSLFAGDYTGDKGEYTYNGNSYTDAWVNTQDFGEIDGDPNPFSDADSVIFGFCYADANGNHEYDIGEGQSGVNIRAYSAGGGDHYTTSDSTGYFQLAAPPSGFTYSIWFGATTGTADLTSFTHSSGHNSMIDAEDPTTVANMTVQSEPFWGFDYYWHLG